MDKEFCEIRYIADELFEYLRKVLYSPANAKLDMARLPREFEDFARGLVFFCDCVLEAQQFALGLSLGNLTTPLPSKTNELAAPLKMLHASLKHLSWQAQQVASGDYKQRVDFMGDFSLAFNNMIKQLDSRSRISHDEKSRLKRYVDLLLVNCPDPILIFDKERKLVQASESYLEKCNIGAINEIFGRSVRELLAPLASAELLELVEGMMQSVALSKKSTKAEQYIELGFKEQRRYYQIQISPMLDEGGRDEGMLVLLDDITEMLGAKEEAERAREAAERSSRAKSDFLARMSHEMRTPMNAIIGMTAIYRASKDEARRTDCIQKIDRAAGHLLGVIDDVLDMANIQTDKFSLIESEFIPQKMLDRIADSSYGKLEEKNQRLCVDIEGDFSKSVIADEQRLAQIILELVSNAAKFTPHGGEIVIGAKKLDETPNGYRLKVWVSDNGIGISKASQQNLFRAFEQISGGVARRYGGSGLGLAICKHIVMLMGGGIKVESDAGLGATFSFEVPIRLALRESSGAEVSDENGMFLGKKILVVEDIEINAEIIVALLQHTGAELDVATDGADALEIFRQSGGDFDLILMDINMPKMDGYEATKQIRALNTPNAKTIPIIAMTANVYREDIEKCLSVGMNSHLGKPINPGTLIGMMRKELKMGLA